MSDSRELLRKLGLTTPAAAAARPEDDEEDACAAFGYLRGQRDRALRLEFRLLNGNRLAFPYSWLGPTHYDPSAGIALRFAGDQVYDVLIEGRNLGRLLETGVDLYERGLQRHRVVWVREMDPEESAALPDEADGVRIIDEDQGGNGAAEAHKRLLGASV